METSFETRKDEYLELPNTNKSIDVTFIWFCFMARYSLEKKICAIFVPDTILGLEDTLDRKEVFLLACVEEGENE